MQDFSDSDILLREFRQEIPIRRTVTLLKGKRQRIHEELQQLLQHLGFLVPPSKGSQNSPEEQTEVIKQALSRLGDDTFTEMVLKLIEPHTGESPPNS